MIKLLLASYALAAAGQSPAPHAPSDADLNLIDSGMGAAPRRGAEEAEPASYGPRPKGATPDTRLPDSLRPGTPPQHPMIPVR